MSKNIHFIFGENNFMKTGFKRFASFVFAVLFIAAALCPAASFAAPKTSLPQLQPLPAPVPYWSVLTPTTACWAPVAGAAGYNWQLYYGDNSYVDSGYIASVSGVNMTYTLSLIDKIKAGKYGAYTLYVQAVPDYKSTVYKSSEYGKTDYLNYTGNGFSIGAIDYSDPYYSAYFTPRYGYNYLLYLWFNNIRCTLDIDKFSGYVGDKKQLNASVITPYRVDIEWTSSDENVAVVDANGLVTLVGPGTAVITATDAFAGSDTCVITVKKDHIIKLN